MHALRRFIREQMDARGWTAADLVRASGLTKQTISVRLSDDRDRLPAPLEDATVAGLARAFGVDPKVVLVKVGEAMGLPMGETVVVYSAEGVSNEELIRVLSERLAKAAEGSGRPPMKNDPSDPQVDDVIIFESPVLVDSEEQEPGPAERPPRRGRSAPGSHQDG